MSWNPNTFGAKVLESNTGTPGSFSDVSSSAAISRDGIPGPCDNAALLQSDPLNNHSWWQGQTVYFEIETVNDTGLTGPPSNVVSFTIPVYNGDASQPEFLAGTTEPICQNPVQVFAASSASLQTDRSFSKATRVS